MAANTINKSNAIAPAVDGNALLLDSDTFMSLSDDTQTADSMESFSDTVVTRMPLREFCSLMRFAPALTTVPSWPYMVIAGESSNASMMETVVSAIAMAVRVRADMADMLSVLDEVADRLELLHEDIDAMARIMMAMRFI